MRVVLDTNVLARAVRAESPAAAVLRYVLSEPHVLILSPFLAELSRTLRLERLRKMHGLEEKGIDAYLQHIQTGALLVSIPMPVTEKVVLNDPNDDPILATALAGSADALCTLDHHFRHPDVLAFCARHTIRVLTDVELLPVLRQKAA